MCGGGAPKPPKPQANYNLMREDKEMKLVQAQQRAEAKRARFEAVFGLRSNRFGRAAVMSGGAGGGGFAAPKAAPTPTASNGA